MKVSLIGTSYVALAAGACLADTRHPVMAMDNMEPRE